MRLGDLDALKEVLFIKFGNQLPNGLLDEIDNAPTVDLKDIYQEGHYDGHLEGYTKAINEERPQGEWIPNYTSQFMNPGRACSLCGKIVEFSENYCPQCGAKMEVPND